MWQMLSVDKSSSHYFWETSPPQHPLFRCLIRWMQQNNTAEAFRDESISCILQILPWTCTKTTVTWLSRLWLRVRGPPRQKSENPSQPWDSGQSDGVQMGLLTFCSTAAHASSHSLPSADRRQITILRKDLNSARSCAQDNRASVGTSERRGLDSLSRGSRRVGGLGHCPTQRQPWNSPLAQWDLPLCLWDNV